MKKLCIALLLSVVMCGCNATKQAAPTPTPKPTPAPSTSMASGTWTLNFGEAESGATQEMMICPDAGCASGYFGTSNEGLSGPISFSLTTSTVDATLVSQCSAYTGFGTTNTQFSIKGPACFIAGGRNGALGDDPNLNFGPGTFVHNPAGIFVGVPHDPAPANSTVNFMLIEAYPGACALDCGTPGNSLWTTDTSQIEANWSIFSGTGTIVNGTMTGSWECDTDYTANCSGMSGTWAATQQN